MGIDNIKNFIISLVSLETLKRFWWIYLIIFIVIFIIIRTKVRGFFFKIKKTGEEIKFKQFFKLWKRGINGITALQQSKGQVMGNIINLIGMIAGFITMILTKIKDVWWWASICLGAGILLTLIGEIGFLQKYFRLKEIDKAIKNINKNVEVKEDDKND